MADRFGRLRFPADAGDDPVGDPGLAKLGDFLRAVINAAGDTAWRQVNPAPHTSQRPLVKRVLHHDPTRRAFNVESLPALFVWRVKGTDERLAEQWFAETGQVRALWVIPALPQEEQRARDPFWQLVAKAVASALELGRSPAWLDAGDTDPLSANLEGSPDALALARATSTAPMVLGGAMLDGVVGSRVTRPRREPTVTTLPAAGAYNTADAIRFLVVDWHGDTVVRRLRLTSADGGETLGLGEDVSRVVAVELPKMLSAAGRFSIGVSEFAGRGSELLTRAELERARLTDWEVVSVDVGKRHALDGDQSATERLPFFGLEMHLEIRELFERDLSATPRASVEADLERADGTLATSLRS